jgi:hypothetical protein
VTTEPFRPAPQSLILEALVFRYTPERPASRIEAWHIAWQMLHQGRPLSRREAAALWCWSEKQARSMVERVAFSFAKWSEGPGKGLELIPPRAHSQEVKPGLSDKEGPGKGQERALARGTLFER